MHAHAGPSVLPLQHEERPALVPEVADAENLLEELDACGVSGMRVAGASSHRPVGCGPTAPPRSPAAARHDTRLLLSGSHRCAHPSRPQVGLIASLRNEHQHRIVEQALTALGCMEHRGACSADDISGDGAGVMTKIPWQLFKAEMPQLKEEVTG